MTEFTPSAAMGFKAVAPRMNYQSRFTVDRSGDGSTVTLKVAGQMKGWWRLMEPFLRGEFKAGIRKELGSLKTVLETPA